MSKEYALWDKTILIMKLEELEAENKELGLLAMDHSHRVTELEAENDQNRADLVKVTRLLAKERAKVERLQEAVASLREALENGNGKIPG